jgi:hypothetical protein
VDANGNEHVDAEGKILSPNEYNFGIGIFNRQLLVKVPKGDAETQSFRPYPGEWHAQDYFRGFDMFIVDYWSTQLLIETRFVICVFILYY